jgi:hypothetical protein
MLVFVVICVNNARAIAGKDVEQRRLAVPRVLGQTGEHVIGLGISPILPRFLIMGNMQATHELSPLIQTRDPVFTMTSVPSR